MSFKVSDTGNMTDLLIFGGEPCKGKKHGPDSQTCFPYFFAVAPYGLPSPTAGIVVVCVCEQDQRDKLDQSVEGGVKLHKGRPGTKAGQGPLYSHLALSILHPPPLASTVY